MASTPGWSFAPYRALPSIGIVDFFAEVHFGSRTFPSGSSSVFKDGTLSTGLRLQFLVAHRGDFLSVAAPFGRKRTFGRTSFASPTLSPGVTQDGFSSNRKSSSPFKIVLPVVVSPN